MNELDAEIGQISADFEIGRFEIGSKVNPHFVHGLKGEKRTVRFFFTSNM